MLVTKAYIWNDTHPTLHTPDDFDLGVKPPGGRDTIDASNPLDSNSGGRLQLDVVPGLSGHWAENIFFPTESGITTGSYIVRITSKATLQKDATTLLDNQWTLTLNQGGQRVTEVSGNETEKMFGIFVEGPLDQCDTIVDKCCATSDCSTMEVCEARNCVKLGQPRFTLSWYGSGEYTVARFVDFLENEYLTDDLALPNISKRRQRHHRNDTCWDRHILRQSDRHGDWW